MKRLPAVAAVVAALILSGCSGEDPLEAAYNECLVGLPSAGYEEENDLVAVATLQGESEPVFCLLDALNVPDDLQLRMTLNTGGQTFTEEVGRYMVGWESTSES